MQARPRRPWPHALLCLINGVMSEIEPGEYVRHPQQPDWGIGQVQSAIGDRVTVNFAHAGKVLINAAVISLERMSEPNDGAALR
jgi:hypothetical protein